MNTTNLMLYDYTCMCTHVQIIQLLPHTHSFFNLRFSLNIWSWGQDLPPHPSKLQKQGQGFGQALGVLCHQVKVQDTQNVFSATSSKHVNALQTAFLAMMRCYLYQMTLKGMKTSDLSSNMLSTCDHYLSEAK